MNLHEYQGKQLLRDFGINVPSGLVVESLEAAKENIKKLPEGVYAVKAQIHAGGRGAGTVLQDPDKKGGVRIAKSHDEIMKAVEAMLGKTLVTKQTGESGSKINKVYIEQGCDIKREMYLSFLVDRELGCPVAVAVAEGGMDIEELAVTNPEKIHKIELKGHLGPQGFLAKKIALALGLHDNIKEACKLIYNLHKLFLDYDLSLLEINPLVVAQVDGEERVIPLDAKVTVDDNAAYRQKPLMAMRDLEEENPTEMEAAEYGLSYISLDGEIGCLVNGAGLAMATMDVIKQHGGEPANFLDVGGSASKENVLKAFKIILSDKKVKGVLVNIFGGIMRCDLIAEGILLAAKEIGIKIPMVVRLRGTNVEEGKDILNKSGLDIKSEDDLDKAAELIVKISR